MRPASASARGCVVHSSAPSAGHHKQSDATSAKCGDVSTWRATHDCTDPGRNVLWYVVAQVTRKIAVRMALGAERSSGRRMVVVQGGRVALLGVVVGILVAFAVPGVLKSLLFGAFDARYIRLHVGRDAGCRQANHLRPGYTVRRRWIRCRRSEESSA